MPMNVTKINYVINNGSEGTLTNIPIDVVKAPNSLY